MKIEIKKNSYYTIFGGIIVGFLAHLFALTNCLKNHDNIVIHGYGTGITSGRWFLQCLGEFIEKIWGNYNISFFNGIIAILFLTLTAYIIALLFKLKNPLLCFLWGAIFLCFPTVTGTMFYMFTVTYYSLAVLMTVYSVYLTENYKFGFIPASILAGCALGIYQAYYPMMISLFVILLLVKLLFTHNTISYYIKRGVLYITTLILTLLFYFIALRISLKHYNSSLSNYYNIDQMGKINVADIPAMLKQTYKNMIKLISEDHCGVSATPIIRSGILILGIFSAIAIIYFIVKLYQRKNILQLIFTIACICILPIAIDSITLMCYNSKMYTLMVYAYVFLLLIPILLMDELATKNFHSFQNHIKSFSTRIICIVMGIMILNYIWLSNGNYMTMYYTTEQTNHYLNSFITMVKSTENFDTSLEWVFIGEDFEDPMYQNAFKETPFKYGGNRYKLINDYSRNRFIERTLGYNINYASDETIKEFEKDKKIKNMPIYPNDGSIVVYKNKVIIKLEDIKD